MWQMFFRKHVLQQRDSEQMLWHAALPCSSMLLGHHSPYESRRFCSIQGMRKVHVTRFHTRKTIHQHEKANLGGISLVPWQQHRFRRGMWWRDGRFEDHCGTLFRLNQPERLHICNPGQQGQEPLCVHAKEPPGIANQQPPPPHQNQSTRDFMVSKVELYPSLLRSCPPY